MAMNKIQQKEYAKLLFLKEGLTQKVIAERVGVTERTICVWAKEGNWDTLKQSLISTRTSIAIKLQEQLNLIQLEIDQRDDKKATPQELKQMVSLVGAIKSLEAEASLGDTINVAMKFCEFVATYEPSLHRNVTTLFDSYLQKVM